MEKILHSFKYSRLIIVLGIIGVWVGLYIVIQPAANWITTTLLGLDLDSRLGSSVAFFLYDVPKILLLLTGMVFIISIIRSFFDPARTKAWLGDKKLGFGNILAAMLGIVTPFCSCSAVPLFIGFVEGGIPLGVTFSFLIAAPMINEVAFVMLMGTFGWRVALIYVISGLFVATLAGIIIGKMKLERYVEDFVWKIQSSGTANIENITWDERINRAWNSVVEILKKVWLYVVIGIAVGAVIHGYVPESALLSIMGKSSWWSVPVAVLLGIPLYSNAAGVIPIVSALMEKGAALGTALAFMMSVIGLSLPEMIILRRVLKPQLIAGFIITVASGIIFTGYLFNIII